MLGLMMQLVLTGVKKQKRKKNKILVLTIILLEVLQEQACKSSHSFREDTFGKDSVSEIYYWRILAHLFCDVTVGTNISVCHHLIIEGD